jgi:hypothetical protein
VKAVLFSPPQEWKIKQNKILSLLFMPLFGGMEL